MRHKEKSPTRLILVRHLDTLARVQRDKIREDATYCELQNFLNDSSHIGENMHHIQMMGHALLAKYGHFDEDRNLEILPGEAEKGKLLGQVLVGTYGMPQRWEVSPFRRTRQSSAAMREGIAMVSSEPLPEEMVSGGIAERNFGDASRYTLMGIYLANHPKALLRHERNPHRFVFENGESKKQFKRRIGRQVWREKWLPRYEGKTSVMVTHNLVIEEQLNQLVGHYNKGSAIWTGTVTVLEAEPKKFLRPRRYHLVGNVGQHVVH